MKSPLRRALHALFTLTLIVYASAAAATFSNVFIFGDSLADAGNNAIIFDSQGAPPGSLRTATPIPSPDFIATFPYAADRYSNGPVWVEQLAASLGLSAAPSLLGGTNFAFGGARSGPLGSPFPFSLLDQANAFLSASSGFAPASALYVIAGGGNDARDAFALAAGGGNPLPLIATYADDIATLLGQLDAAGAQRILLANVPDIGKTPAIQSLDAVLPGAATLATDTAAAMNAALAAELATLPAALLDGLAILNTFDLVDAIFTDATAFGLTDATSACAFACPAGAENTFFWDGVHPTTAGHGVFAQAALAALPEPSTLMLTLLALAFLARRATTILRIG